MSWIQQLYHTYEHAKMLDLPTEQALSPIGHTLQNAHINIVLDGEGNFLRAQVLKKTQILLPATEISESRANVEAPHALADKLQYVAQDYPNYGGIKKAYFQSYHDQLEAWCKSEFGHSSAQAVLSYIKKGQVIQDLINQNILFIDEQNQFLTKWDRPDQATPDIYAVLPKEKGVVEFGSALVCWTIEKIGNNCPNTWQDNSLQESWVNYLLSQEGVAGFCYVTGKQKSIAKLHPAKIRHSGDKAKLISANDKTGFTFRGRFLDNLEATSVSSEVSQKAHAALRWLASGKRAHRNGDQVTVAWALSPDAIPQPLESVMDWEEFDEDSLDEKISEDELVQDQLDNTIDYHQDVGQKVALKIKKMFQGYKQQLDKSSIQQVSLISLDSATTGRMAITYYQQFLLADYLKALEQWQTDFAWYQRHTAKIEVAGKKDKSITTWPVFAPSPYMIAQTAYGGTFNEALRKQVNSRLLPCIAEGRARAFPEDLMRLCIYQACNPFAGEKWEWERNVGVACAVYKGFYTRHPDQQKRRSFNMGLDESLTSRDYLYGRLLAVAERIEEVALQVAGEKRATTAERYIQQFAEHPYSTWRNIELALTPYIARLRNNRAGFLHLREQELTKITDSFEREDFISDKRLSGEFLLGYHSQKMVYRTKAQSTVSAEENTTN